MKSIKPLYSSHVKYHNTEAFATNLPAEQPKNKTMCLTAKEPDLAEADKAAARLWQPTSAETADRNTHCEQT
jgi:hypothetical protein